MAANTEIPHAVALSEYGPDDDGRLSDWASTVTANGFTGGEPGMATDDENKDADRGGLRSSLRSRSSEPALRDLLSCPFRKKNPARFNVRDYHICTGSFMDFSKLKRHIKEHHLRKDANQVRREAEPLDPEDGINMATFSRLTTKVGHLKVNTWAGLWGVLFPDDDEIPSSEPCIPMETVELKEAHEMVRCQWWHPTTLEQVLDMLSRGESQIDTAWLIITWADSSATKLLDESSEAFSTTALERLTAGLAKPRRREPSKVDHRPERLRTTPQTSGRETRELPTQSLRPVRPRALVLSSAGDTGDEFTSPSPAVYSNSLPPAHRQDLTFGTLEPQPPLIRDQRWPAVPVHATTGAGSAAARAPVQHLGPLNADTPFHQRWQRDNSAQDASSTPCMHRGRGQVHIAGNYQSLQPSPVDSYTSRHGQYPSVPVNPGTRQPSSVDFTPHSGELYTHGSFAGWQGTGGDNTGEEEE